MITMKTMIDKLMTSITRSVTEFFRLFGIAAFAICMSWMGYWTLARFGFVPDFEISLEGLYWVIFKEFVTIMVTVFMVRLTNGDYNKN